MNKRIFSFALSVLMLLTVLATLPFATVTAATINVTSTNPVITANVGENISLSDVKVEGLSGSVVWKNGTNTITSFKATEKGVTPLTATAGNVTKNVYFVAKNANEKEYVLYENDFSGTLDDLKNEGWKFGMGNAFSAINNNYVGVSGGQLRLGAKENDYVRAILPEWLGDFGDYAIDLTYTQTNNANNARWASIVYRIENENKQYYPYYHMCVRVDGSTTNSVEFAERTSANNWNVIYTAAHGSNTSTGMHTVRVEAFGNTVNYLFDGTSALYVSDATKHTKGYIGLTVNYGEMHADSIKVTVQQNAPARPAVAAKLINTAENRQETNISNYFSNQALATTENFDSLLSADKLPVAILLDLTGKTVSQAEFENYLKACAEKYVIPEFKLDTAAQVDALDKALTATKVPETMVISSDPAIVKKARTAKATVIRGALDVSETLNADSDKKEIFKAYTDTVGCYAQAVLLPYDAATKENVAYLQELQIAVWVKGENINNKTKASWMIASGAHALLSDNWTLVDDTQKLIFDAQNSLTRTPVITGHRGDHNSLPENSIPAYLKALENGADCIETDVHLTSDGVVVINHNGTIDATSNGVGAIASMTLAQLQQYKLKNPNGSLSNETYPTFELLLQTVKDKDCRILCELKSGETALSQKCADLIRKYEMEDRVVFISFNANQLNNAKRNISVSTGYLLSAIGAVPANDAAANLNSYFTQQSNCLNYNSNMAINFGNMTAEFLRDATDRGMTLFSWTYGTGSTSKTCEMFLAGMNGETTDYPAYTKNTVKTLYTPADLSLASGNTAKAVIESKTYVGKVEDVASKCTYVVLDGEDVISVAADGTVSALKDGVATYIASYQATLPNGTKYTLYTQPITVRVGDAVDPGETSDPTVSSEDNDGPEASEVSDASVVSDTSASSGNTVGIVIGIVCVLIVGAIAVIVILKKRS